VPCYSQGMTQPITANPIDPAILLVQTEGRELRPIHENVPAQAPCQIQAHWSCTEVATTTAMPELFAADVPACLNCREHLSDGYVTR
jgi:hypothetical protein